MDIYVNDAFGSAHRAHASTVGVAELLPAYAGFLLERELEMLGRLLGEVEHPFVLVAGGAKVEDKLGVLEHLGGRAGTVPVRGAAVGGGARAGDSLGVLEHLGGRADTVLVGGKMAEELRDGSPLPFEAELPSDVVAAAAFDARAAARGAPPRAP